MAHPYKNVSLCALAFTTLPMSFIGCGDEDPTAPLSPPVDESAPTTIRDLGVGVSLDSAAVLVWTAPQDLDAGERVADYEIWFSERQPSGSPPVWDGAEVISIRTPGFPGQPERYEATGLASLASYYFAVRSIDSSGNTSEYSNVTSTTTGYFLQWGESGQGDGQFTSPTSIAVDALGDVYVTDSHRIHKFDSNGTWLLSWGSKCHLFVSSRDCVDPDDEGPLELGDGQFSTAADVAVGVDGSVYVADGANRRVQVFDANGTFLRKWPVELWTRRLAIDSKLNVYVSVPASDTVRKYDRDDNLVAEWTWEFNQQPFRLSALTVGVNDALLVGGHERIWQVEDDGSIRTLWGTPGSGDGQFERVTAMDVDEEGNVYVIDARTSRLQVFDADGGLWVVRGSEGSKPGQFLSAVSVDVDAQGSVLVLDHETKLVSRYGTVAGNATGRRW